jgi:hypothetical protein
MLIVVLTATVVGFFANRVRHALWPSTKVGSARKIDVGKCAAHAMVLYLYDLPISVINATGSDYNGAPDRCALRMPENIEETANFVRCAVFAKAAENTMEALAQELLRGQTLVGFCNNENKPLSSKEEVMEKADRAFRNTLNNPDISDEERVWFIDFLARRVVAHYYLAVVHLAAELIKKPLVTGKTECLTLIENCLQEAPINSLQLVCAPDD